MKQRITRILQSAVLVPALAFGMGLFAMVPVSAASCTSNASGGLSAGASCAQSSTDQPSNLFGPSGIFKTITNVLLYIIGAIAVIMLIIGGIRYVVSAGDSGAVTAAKNTILYAVIGIVVAILAYALVNFVIGSFAANGSTS